VRYPVHKTAELSIERIDDRCEPIGRPHQTFLDGARRSGGARARSLHKGEPCTKLARATKSDACFCQDRLPRYYDSTAAENGDDPRRMGSAAGTRSQALSHARAAGLSITTLPVLRVGGDSAAASACDSAQTRVNLGSDSKCRRLYVARECDSSRGGSCVSIGHARRSTLFVRGLALRCSDYGGRYVRAVWVPWFRDQHRRFVCSRRRGGTAGAASRGTSGASSSTTSSGTSGAAGSGRHWRHGRIRRWRPGGRGRSTARSSPRRVTRSRYRGKPVAVPLNEAEDGTTAPKVD